jgi:nitric oxide dioxygenase
MTPAEVDLVEATWGRVSGSPDAVAELFYSHLFRANPELRALFRSDMLEQGRKLAATLALVVAGLRRPAGIRAAVHALGARHREYGVLPAHYPLVGAALLDTLRTALGEEFRPDVEKAWSSAFAFVSEVMIRAAQRG